MAVPNYADTLSVCDPYQNLNSPHQEENSRKGSIVPSSAAGDPNQVAGFHHGNAIEVAAVCTSVLLSTGFRAAISGPSREVPIFQAKQGFVPRPHYGQFASVPALADFFCRAPAKELLNPKILPR